MGLAANRAWGAAATHCVGIGSCLITYLFSKTTSGSQTMVEGTRSVWMSSYCSGSHRRR